MKILQETFVNGFSYLNRTATDRWKISEGLRNVLVPQIWWLMSTNSHHRMTRLRHLHASVARSVLQLNCFLRLRDDAGCSSTFSFLSIPFVSLHGMRGAITRHASCRWKRKKASVWRFFPHFCFDFFRGEGGFFLIHEKVFCWPIIVEIMKCDRLQVAQSAM